MNKIFLFSDTTLSRPNTKVDYYYFDGSILVECDNNLIGKHMDSLKFIDEKIERLKFWNNILCDVVSANGLYKENNTDIDRLKTVRRDILINKLQ